MAAALVAGSALAKPAAHTPAAQWRDAFASSPASYAPPSEEMIRSAAEHMKRPAEAIRESLNPRALNGTVRYRVTLAAGGSRIRIRLSNEEGPTPLAIAAVSVGIAGPGLSARPGSIKPVTFGSASSLVMPAAAPALSDPVDLPVSAGAELVVSVALASPLLNDARGGGIVALVPGDQTMREVFDNPAMMPGRSLVSAVSVSSSRPPRVIVALGDSITDGNRARDDELHGWPEELAHRLNAARPGAYAVVNAGIGGNRLLARGWGAAGLARLDRDALRLDGVSHLILLEGINDIGMSGRSGFGDNPEITAPELIAGYRQVIARAQARGISVIIGTLLPSTGSSSHSSPYNDQVRDLVNQWIRTSGEPDGVIDFNKVMTDPAAPGTMRRDYDSGDHLHPSEAGYKAMGDSIDLTLFD